MGPSTGNRPKLSLVDDCHDHPRAILSKTEVPKKRVGYEALHVDEGMAAVGAGERPLLLLVTRGEGTVFVTVRPRK